MKNILIIEDDVNVVGFIQKGLAEEGFVTSVAFDGDQGIQMASENAYSMVLLDIMIPGKNGIEVCKELRAMGNQTPILFLTALNTSDNVALGLNSGADDYLVKPFKFNELLARIKAILRRVTAGPSFTASSRNLISVGDLVVDDDAKTVVRNGTTILLTATEYRLLMAFLRNRGKVLSRMELLESAWDINFNMGTNVVDVYVNYLRKKIDAAHEHKLIHTVIGMGYVLREA